jgi:hypothetical protein
LDQHSGTERQGGAPLFCSRNLLCKLGASVTYQEYVDKSAMEFNHLKSLQNGNRRGRAENLKRGKKKGDAPSRKLSEQKVKQFCLYFLTNGESIKAAGLHIGLSPTYIYEFYKKPEVQTKLLELRNHLDEKTLEALNEHICTRPFIDERLALIIADPHPHPRRGFSDQIAAARLAADIGGLTGTGQKQAPILNANIIQTSILGSDVYMPQIDRRRRGIHDQRSSDIEQRLLGSNETEAPAVGAENKGSSECPE